MAKKLKDAIKEMETKVRETIVDKIVEIKQDLVSFDAWWHMRAHNIPLAHIKEIVLADFKSRGLSLNETIERFDDALAKYGIKLK